MNEPDWADEIVKDLRDDEDELLPFVVMRSVADAIRSAVETRDKRIKELEEALKQIAGLSPWDNSEQGYVDKARAALEKKQ